MGGARAQALEEKTAWLWMAAALGPGAPNSGMALSMFPDARALAQACWKEDLSMVFTPAQLAALRAARPEDYTARLDDCARHGVNVLTWADEDYPDLLRAVSAPPPCCITGATRASPTAALHSPLWERGAPPPTAWRRQRPSRANWPGRA